MTEFRSVLVPVFSAVQKFYSVLVPFFSASTEALTSAFSTSAFLTHCQEHYAKNRLPIPDPSPEKPVAEIIPLKKSDLSSTSILTRSTLCYEPNGKFSEPRHVPVLRNLRVKF